MKDHWKRLQKEYGILNDNSNLYQIIQKNIDSHPEDISLEFQGEDGTRKTWTYLQAGQEIDRISSILLRSGIKKGERVALFLPKCPEIYFGTLAAIKIGAIAMPLFEAFKKDGLDLRLSRGEANYLITNKELLKRYKRNSKIKKVFVVDSKSFKNQKRLPHIDIKKVNPKDPCLMIFTSSTAGTPVAGIMIPHSGTVQWIYTSKKILDLERGRRYFCSAHPAWVTGAIYGVIAPFLIGSRNYVIEGRFDSKIWKKFIFENKIESMYTAPTVFRLVKEEITKRDIKYLKRVCSVGEPLSKSLVEYYKKLGIKIIDTYWQTETGAIVIANIPFKLGSLGRAIGVNIRVVKGEIFIKTPWPALMVDIWKHPKMFKSYFVRDVFKTNDLARVDSKGYFYFEGRKDDIIKTSGERVSPLEVENALLKLRQVKECVVVGIPDQRRGHILKAYIVLNEKVKPSEELKTKIMSFVKSNYSGHAYPKVIQFVETLPKGNSDKIIRSKLKN